VFRRFAIALVIFLLVAVVAADRVGAIVAGHILASKVKTDENLRGHPTATIGGIPFLTQALSGTYRDVTIEANNVPVDGVNVTSMTVHLYKVHIPIGDVVNGAVLHVPVKRVAGSAFVAFGDINTYLDSHHPSGQVLFLRASTGNTATIFDQIRIGGKTIAVRGVGTVQLAGNAVAVKVTHLERNNGAALPPSVLESVLSRLSIFVPLDDLPFRMTLRSVTMTSTGITVTGGAVNAVLGGHGR
jgi:hypothetical protein